jgi:hypothetical protein
VRHCTALRVSRDLQKCLLIWLHLIQNCSSIRSVRYCTALTVSRDSQKCRLIWLHLIQNCSGNSSVRHCAVLRVSRELQKCRLIWLHLIQNCSGNQLGATLRCNEWFSLGALLSLASSHCTQVSMLCSKGHSFCPELVQFYSQSGTICPSSPAILTNARSCPVPIGCSVGMGTGYGLDGSQLGSR